MCVRLVLRPVFSLFILFVSFSLTCELRRTHTQSLCDSLSRLREQPARDDALAVLWLAARRARVAAALGLGEVNPVYQTLLGEDREVLKIQTRFDQSRDVLAGLQEAFPKAGLQEVGVNQIGASVSSDIQWNALQSVFFALLGILLYVALRFEVGYGIGAVVATIHDVLMTVGIFVICGALGIFVSGQFTAPMLAAILMIVGYSINDTIVVFDRIREELELNPGTDLRRIINLAISRVFSRSLLTSLTTLLAAVSLYIFGAGVINDFAFVFIIGILTGTFSSIFIASPVFFHRSLEVSK